MELTGSINITLKRDGDLTMLIPAAMPLPVHIAFQEAWQYWNPELHHAQGDHCIQER